MSGKVSGHGKGEDELKFEGYRKCYCQQCSRNLVVFACTCKTNPQAQTTIHCVLMCSWNKRRISVIIIHITAFSVSLHASSNHNKWHHKNNALCSSQNNNINRFLFEHWICLCLIHVWCSKCYIYMKYYKSIQSDLHYIAVSLCPLLSLACTHTCTVFLPLVSH